MKKLLLILTFFCITLSAAELIKDPTFKKKNKYWKFTALEEYENVEPKYKRKTVEFDITHTSEFAYISFITEADTKDDKIYKVQFKFKGDGQGEVIINHISYPNFYKGKPYVQGSPLSNMGLHQRFEPKAEWQTATCYLKSNNNPEKNYMKSLVFMMGLYQGKLSISEVSVTEAKDKSESALPAHGSIAISKK
ncbi:hypothetical protein PQO03_13310 [Lentisphaera profundi]|uniref:Carbohydrate-binding domain-containing protein n=1 Tax=Lentisphaera profundi TaxID=1658616 RepID=A0ABY7VYL5_9BACT|nr:hypothetical protein [Lentisphaera profundi]WDE98812.1 hypothetical protein PQO03_13310 [Lentisphaera profundi]